MARTTLERVSLQNLAHAQAPILEIKMSGEEHMNDALTDTRRRHFLQFTGSVVAGMLVPAFFSVRAGHSNDVYAVINGWVVPFSHLKADIDA
jgi:hypothetical protein